MTEAQTPHWLRRTLSGVVLGGLMWVGFLVMRPFMVAIAWAAVLTWCCGRCTFACWCGCEATGAGLHSP